MANKEDELIRPEEKVPWAYVEILNRVNNSNNMRLWIALIVALVLAFAYIAYDKYQDSQYDMISYEQDGQGNNIIGDNNRGYYYEPEIEDTTETE